uniref:Hypothetical chloroplast RF1 n=1 Tax=Schizomeris leibleinii TaxID=104533 RepID=F8SY83_9CHLO|nr:hypothetical chloroplast RF1 [Schizomeris leibleinii]AEH05409.1 hypothetical chloroplast RF1 [Schizomeris leibleinii]
MTLVTAVKDYVEVVHKLIETSPSYVLQNANYSDSLTILNFGLSTIKQICSNILSFEWLKQLWYLPIIVPEIASSMISEISVLDGTVHNMLTFLDQPISMSNQVYGNLDLPLTCFEKIFTGLINSLFLWIPTSTATFICFRRFIMQGVEAGYAAALGTMAANIFWLASILFGLRFIVVPWMSLDLFRYFLGFLLLMKYFWDNRFAYKEVKHTAVFGKQTLQNIFSFHFLLALTEQTSLYPFLSNFSISAQSTLFESFPSDNFLNFSLIHISYLLGIGIGSYSLIHLICWFWQDPAYRFYFWLMNKFKKLRVVDIVRPVHLFFQSITVAFAFSSLPYFGIEYAVTNPLGFVPNDQTFHQFKQTSFLTHSTSPAYYRSRFNFPRQKFFRYEDWAEYYHRNMPLDTSLYDQGAYRLYTMEDLSYGTDYEWMRRRSDKIKIRSRLKRLRWFPRNWANRLWDFTKTWSRRNVAWRNDILNMYQFSWDSKAPIVWGKLVREELFPKLQTIENIPKEALSRKSNETTKTGWGSFWGPDPDWTSKFLWNQNSSNSIEKQYWWNWQSRRNLSDNDNWWKWLSESSQKNENSKALQQKKLNINADFWEPQQRLISNYALPQEKNQQEEYILEFSTLRKFVRKLSSRLKFSQIEENANNKKPVYLNTNLFKNKISSNLEHIQYPGFPLKTLLLLPHFTEWNSFQKVLTNVNKVLWWSRLTTLTKSQSNKNLLVDSFDEYNGNNLQLNNQKNLTNSTKMQIKSSSFLFENPNNLITDNNADSLNLLDNSKIRKYLNWNNKISLFDKKLIKFEKIQNKLFELPNTNLSTFSNDSIENSFIKSKKLDIQSLKQKIDKKRNRSVSFLKIAQEPQKIVLSNNKNFTNTDSKVSVYKNSTFYNTASSLNKELGVVSSSNLSLLHPIKYYLHKEQNFKRKLRFYGVKASGTLAKKEKSFAVKNLSNDAVLQNNSSIKNDLIKNTSTQEQINNLPIFNFYMKTYFQNYKPTRLYVMNTKMKRQLGMGASARRKGRDYTNKLLKRSKILSGTPWIRQWVNQSGFLARRKRLETWIRRQHYDPNELWSKIMKMDVDLFINRQPSSHFLTNTEEKLLHLRRFLLFEHYDSLRWYTYMKNYRTMKNTIGGTKSFTSRLYNQQFKGTFHKVRHLFALTPSSSNGSLLKFDQPLYNNSNINNNVSLWHEELDKNAFSQKIESNQNTLFTQKELDQPSYKEANSFNSSLNKQYLNGKSSFNMLSSNKKRWGKTSFMISLFKKRQKMSTDYKRASEKLWKKWKLKTLHNSTKIQINKIKTISPLSENKERVSLNNGIISNLPFSITENQITPSNIDQKLYQILKIKKLAELNQKSQISENMLSPNVSLTNTFNNTNSGFLSQKSNWKIATKTAIRKALKEAVDIQNNPNAYLLNDQDFGSLKQLLATRRLEYKNILVNVDKNITKKVIKSIYNKSKGISNNTINQDPYDNSNNSVFSVLNKFWQNKITKTNNTSKNSLLQAVNFQNSTQSNTNSIPVEIKNEEYSKDASNFNQQGNIALYEKNFMLRERSNLQNYVLMKKILLNDSSSSGTRHQIRPLPGSRTKALYEKQSMSDLVLNSNAISKNGLNLGLRKKQISFSSLGSSINTLDNKIRAYKTRKWIESNSLNNFVLTSEFKRESKFSYLNKKNNSSLLQKLNKNWNSFLNNLQTDLSLPIESNRMDKQLQDKLLLTSNSPEFENLLSKTVSDNKNLISSNILLNEKLSGVVLKENLLLRDIMRQRLTKTIQSKQKTQTLLEMPNRIRRTKQRRKRQQTLIKRNLLRRHVSRKNRRKFIVKTKEINNQRMVLDRKYEIEERLFLNKIDQINSFLPQLKTKPNNIEFQSDSTSNLSTTIKNQPLFIGNKIPSQNQNSSKLKMDSILDNFLIWMLMQKQIVNSNSSDNLFVKTSENSTVTQNLLDTLTFKNNTQKTDFKTNNFPLWWNKEKSKNPLNKIETSLIDSKYFTSGKNLSNFKDKNSQGGNYYLSSVIRSSRIVNRILTEEQNSKLNKNLEKSEDLLKQSFLRQKLDSSLTNSNEIENEKSRLRRSLRKFSSSNPISVEKINWIKKLSKSEQNSYINNLLTVDGVVSKNNGFSHKEKNLFLNNLALSTWLQRVKQEKQKQSLPNIFKKSTTISGKVLLSSNEQSELFKTNTFVEKPQEFSLKEILSSISNKQNSSQKENLMNLNKYIITARTTPSKISRQQIRKKTRKRRIIRTKRLERLKTLQDHPLKFRSDQIQTFYNLQDSLKKWKNFAFISSKQKYINTVENTLSDKYLSKQKNKNFDFIPFSNFKNDNSSYFDRGSSYKYTNTNTDLLYNLYSNIFGNPTTVEEEKTEDFMKNTSNIQKSQLLINTNPIPFYAGWDETVRKFVITNRLLSRQEAGYEISSTIFNSLNTNTNVDLNNQQVNIEFSSWPLKGKNAATTLYAQFPFMIAPQTKLNYSDKQIIQLKGGTKYQLTDLNQSISLKTSNNASRIENKWISKSTDLVDIGANLKQLKLEKRIKNQIKSGKNEDHGSIRQYGQVISNLAVPAHRKVRRRALFAPLRWQNKKQTTKSILKTTKMDIENNSLNQTKFFKTKTTGISSTKNSLKDKKLLSKVTLLRTFRQGNRAQMRAPRIQRLQKFIRPNSSAWKWQVSLARRKKQRIKSQTKAIAEGNAFSAASNSFNNLEKTRYIIRKRKKRGNNKNPRLRGDKNIRQTKRQLRQKLYLRPKNRPLRRRSLGVNFQNKLNYWRRQSIDLYTETNSSNPNIKDTNKFFFSTNLNNNSKYSNSSTEWKEGINMKDPQGFLSLKKETPLNLDSRRPRKLYRSLFKNPSLHIPILYETLPGHSRSLPLIKNLPAPGSSVKTLNRVIKWSSADGAARFHRVNLAYGWALELFLRNLHQKIGNRLENNILLNQELTERNSKQLPNFRNEKTTQNSLNSTVILQKHQDYLTKVLNNKASNFTLNRSFNRRAIKLRQLSYTMSLRLYDRWFFYYYANKGNQANNKLLVDQLNSENLDQNHNLMNNIRKFFTFHLNDTQSTFRAYLKNLRILAKKRAEKLESLKENTISPNLNTSMNITTKSKTENNTLTEGLESFKLKTNTEILEGNKGQYTNQSTNLSEFEKNQTTNKTLLKKEKKMQEDRFFFAQFNRPPLVDDYRITREVNRHYPLNGGFVWPGDYLRLKTIQIPRNIKSIYLENNKNNSFTNLSKNFLEKEKILNKKIYN